MGTCQAEKLSVLEETWGGSKYTFLPLVQILFKEALGIPVKEIPDFIRLVCLKRLITVHGKAIVQLCLSRKSTFLILCRLVVIQKPLGYISGVIFARLSGVCWSWIWGCYQCLDGIGVDAHHFFGAHVMENNNSTNIHEHANDTTWTLQNIGEHRSIGAP